IAAALPTSGFNITPEDFLAAAYSPTGGYEILANLPKGASVEGFMLPGSYQLDRDLSANELIHTILENYRGIISGDLQQSIHRQGLNLFQAITLASIVEREAIVQEEQPIIASVFLNRLAIAMKLEADPTVQYALGYNPTQGTWWTNPLSAANLIFDSPYNTYLYPNLPPGPISNPSFSALQAVAFAADTPYYFFRAACDGSGRHTFAETYIEHQNNGCVN
ncbi:MAG: endolytic transglycosylase MltG, partial [Anaerolineae bacterium]|nr:endolytic transglycosylase MltG [Anaerolineae bacterium]